jgi:hypothetical protein
MTVKLRGILIVVLIAHSCIAWAGAAAPPPAATGAAAAGVSQPPGVPGDLFFEEESAPILAAARSLMEADENMALVTAGVLLLTQQIGTEGVSPEVEVEELMNAVVPFAEQMLNEHGAFFPYGGAIQADGAIVSVAGYHGGESPPQRSSSACSRVASGRRLSLDSTWLQRSSMICAFSYLSQTQFPMRSQ